MALACLSIQSASRRQWMERQLLLMCGTMTELLSYSYAVVTWHHATVYVVHHVPPIYMYTWRYVVHVQTSVYVSACELLNMWHHGCVYNCTFSLPVSKSLSAHCFISKTMHNWYEDVCFPPMQYLQTRTSFLSLLHKHTCTHTHTHTYIHTHTHTHTHTV